MDLRQLERTTWDVIVVGTGMGGATIGLALARQGRKVLFCEKGRSLLELNQGLRGAYAEALFERPEVPAPRHRETLLQSGRCAEEIVDVSHGKARRHVPFIGIGPGGSSAIYGAALERFFPEDFRPRDRHPNVDDSSLPEEWPISYDDLRPYYEAAEELYRVRGGHDPCHTGNGLRRLLPPPPISAPVEEIADFLTRKGLHPYRLPVGCEYDEGCSGCQGFLCNRRCKNDAARICLLPALQEHGAELIAECEVLQLLANRREVTALVCSCRGETVRLKGAVIILAAGALETPRILLSSTSDDWPGGLANESGLVGKNLMRHFIDLFAVQPHTKHGHPGNHKELAFNDFYLADGRKYGTIQSFGSLPPASVIVAGLEKDLREGWFRWIAPVFHMAKPLLTHFMDKMLTQRVLFASILEDIPYEGNRVSVAQPTVGFRAPTTIQYRIREYDRGRIEDFRKCVRGAFLPYRTMIMKQAENNERIAHACGTCRFGNDPKHSVLNSVNRCHDVCNLYVVDASFFPSSGGTNPALTIAANSLRVADAILHDGRLHNSACQSSTRTSPDWQRE